MLLHHLLHCLIAYLPEHNYFGLFPFRLMAWEKWNDRIVSMERQRSLYPNFDFVIEHYGFVITFFAFAKKK